jgi:hypothetical protein
VAAPEAFVIASLRGLVALALVACALVGAVVLDVARTAPPVDRAVLPGFDGKLDELHWTRPGGPEVRIVRDGERWAMAIPKGEVDPRAVENVLAALRGARWHRRGSRTQAGTIHATLAFHGHTIELGEPIAGADQRWIVVDDRALLVDGWVVRTIDLDPLALRDRTPFASGVRDEKITVRGPNFEIALEASPRRTRDVLVAPAAAERLERALEHLEIIRLPDNSTVSAKAPIELEVCCHKRGSLSGGLPCAGAPNLIEVHGQGGAGCVDRAAWNEMFSAARALAGPPAEVVDRRPAAMPLVRIALPDGMLDVERRPQVTVDGTKRDADPDRVAALIGALAEPAKPVALPAAKPEAALAITPRGGESFTIDLYSAHVVARRGEPVGLELSASAWATLRRPVADLVDPTRWLEDPSAVSTLVLDGVTFTRGAVLGEWMRSPTGAVDSALVEALASAVAQVRAPTSSSAVTPLHRLDVTFAPPVGKPTTHHLELGAPGPEGCPAKVDGTTVTAPLSLCTAVFAVARH